MYYDLIARVNPKDNVLAIKNSTRRSFTQLLAAAKQAHGVIWESFRVVESIISVILRVILAPFLLIIIIADVVIASTILAVVGICVGFVVGWITPAEAINFTNVHLAAVLQSFATDVQAWTATHQDSPIAPVIGAIGPGN